MSSIRVRGAKYEFFLTRWAAMYEWVSGSVKASQGQAGATAAVASLETEEAVRLSVLLRKAIRAREVLHQLQDLETRHTQLEVRVQPLLDTLPQLQHQIKASAAAAAAAAALSPAPWVLGASAAGAAGVVGSAPSIADRFGIQTAFWGSSSSSSTSSSSSRSSSEREGEQQQQEEEQNESLQSTEASEGQPRMQSPPAPAVVTRSLLSSPGDYATAVTRVAEAAQLLLTGPDSLHVERLASDRWTLATEMSALTKALPPDLQLPSTAPLSDGAAALGALARRISDLEAAHLSLLRTALDGVDWGALDCRLRSIEATYPGSSLQAAVQRLKLTRDAMVRGQRPPADAWQEIADDAELTAAAVKHWRDAQSKSNNSGGAAALTAMGSQRAAAEAFSQWRRQLEGRGGGRLGTTGF